ncbi:PREDICTED: uncharacterized protein LOC104801921 [Tarenaya hassleriana]|uniref:uncharacterized protein LOC104801921 n=1 Tax=Tarenaya hassleriana TaxID=28532 RepID=UPI00053C3C9B|nr:PREDICTED: uncharacterized protein LOC104801921 [Tarenaya hassleriana]
MNRVYGHLVDVRNTSTRLRAGANNAEPPLLDGVKSGIRVHIRVSVRNARSGLSFVWEETAFEFAHSQRRSQLRGSVVRIEDENAVFTLSLWICALSDKLMLRWIVTTREFTLGYCVRGKKSGKKVDTINNK